MIAYTLAPSLPSCPSSSAYTHTHTTGSFSTLDYFFLEAVPTPPPFNAECLDPISFRTTVAAAMLDRLLHRSVVVNLDGESYRLRDHHAAAESLRRATTGTRQRLH